MCNFKVEAALRDQAGSSKKGDNILDLRLCRATTQSFLFSQVALSPAVAALGS